MLGDYEKELQFEIDGLKRQINWRKKISRLLELCDERNKLDDELEKLRTIKLVWQGGRMFGVKVCTTQKEAIEFVKKNKVQRYMIIDGVIMHGNIQEGVYYGI